MYGNVVKITLKSEEQVSVISEAVQRNAQMFTYKGLVSRDEL